MNIKGELERLKKDNNDYHSIGSIVVFNYVTNGIDIIQSDDKKIKNYLTGNAGITLSRYTEQWVDRQENIDFLTRYVSEVNWNKRGVKKAYHDWVQTSWISETEMAGLKV